MIRILVMGREAQEIEKRLRHVCGDALQIESARLPAQGIRRLDETPPDAVLIGDEQGRATTLVEVIRSRPLGRLIPLVLVSPRAEPGDPSEDASSLGVAAWVVPETSAFEIARLLAEVLDLTQEDMFAQETPSEQERETPQVQRHDDFVVEPLPDRESGPSSGAQSPGDPGPTAPLGPPPFEPPPKAVEPLERRSLFPVRPSEVRVGEVSEEVLRRKLKEVRHEDYYTVLEVRRGAEGAVIREAYQRLRARYDQRRLDFEIVRRFYDEIDEIQDALEDAWAVLGDPDLREKYVAASAR